jgi:hypothetical protein
LGLIGTDDLWKESLANLERLSLRSMGTILNPEIFERMTLLDNDEDIENALRSWLADRHGKGPWSQNGNGGHALWSARRARGHTPAEEAA